MDKIFLRRQQYVVHLREEARTCPLRTTFTTEFGLLFPLRAELELNLGVESFRLAPTGDALLVNPGPDELSVSGDGYLSLAVAPIFLLDAAVRAGITRGGALVAFRARVVRGDRRLRRASADLADELRQEEVGQGAIVGAIVEHILVHSLRRHSDARRADQIEVSRAGLVDRRIRRAVELMHVRLDEELPLDELAAAAYLSPFHFARLFKKLVGVTPHAYLAALRAERARQLLAETDLSVTEVGARVGYASASHFSKAFRRATGLTPRDFRASLVRGQR